MSKKDDSQDTEFALLRLEVHHLRESFDDMKNQLKMSLDQFVRKNEFDLWRKNFELQLKNKTQKGESSRKIVDRVVDVVLTAVILAIISLVIANKAG